MSPQDDPWPRRGALRSPSRWYNTAHYPDSLTHFPRLNPQDLDQGARFARNLELLDPFESQALVPSSVFTLLLNPNWLAASGSEEREHFTTQLDQDGRRMDRPAEPERQSVALLTRTVRNSENHWISRPPSRPAGLVGQTWQPVQVRNTWSGCFALQAPAAVVVRRIGWSRSEKVVLPLQWYSRRGGTIKRHVWAKPMVGRWASRLRLVSCCKQMWA